MQINPVGWQQLNRVWGFGFFFLEGKRRRRRVNGSDRERIEHVTKRRRRRRWWERRREGGRMDAGCSHGQAHSSCSACWDAPGSVQHNTITACSGVLCSAPLCSDSVLLSFVTFALFPLPLSLCFSPFFFFLLPPPQSVFGGTFLLSCGTRIASMFRCNFFRKTSQLVWFLFLFFCPIGDLNSRLAESYFFPAISCCAFLQLLLRYASTRAASYSSKSDLFFFPTSLMCV